MCVCTVGDIKYFICNTKSHSEGSERRKIRLIEGNAKCRDLKTLTCKGDFAAGRYESVLAVKTIDNFCDILLFE
jgi:hypothetical protein